MKLRNLSIIILLVGIIAFSGCAKKKQELLVGTWERFPLHESDLEHIEIWKFDGAGTLTLSYDSVDHIADYKTLNKSFKAFVETSGLDSVFSFRMDGLYKIQKIDDENLILHCDEPYIHKEFTRLD